MANTTKHIGLSLGADICWPIAYEALFEALTRDGLKIGGKTLDFAVERVTIEPYSLRQPVRYDVVIDRLTHWYTTSREWIKKAILVDDLYVYNNPWSLQSNEKQTSYAAMMRLGLHVPETWMLPPKAYDPSDDLEPTLTRNGYDATALVTHLNARPSDIRAFLAGTLDPEYSRQLTEQLRQAGVPV